MATEYDSENEEVMDEMCFVQEIKDSDIKKKNQLLLEEYIKQMSYRPVHMKPVCFHTEKLAKPKSSHLAFTAKKYGKVLQPERKARLKRLNQEFSHMTAEEFEKKLKRTRAKEKELEKRQLRKQDVFYELLQKLESQCRGQYLNVMIKKFADFIAKLATTMRIPPQLVDPYARMHRGIFCNILHAIGLKPVENPNTFYNAEEANKYEVGNKLSHALLSLIIKALDEAAAKDPNEIIVEPVEEGPWDKYIKERLMCVAAKKCKNEDTWKKKAENSRLNEIIRKCHNFDECYEYL